MANHVCMYVSAEVGEEDDFASVGKTKSSARSRSAWKDMLRQAEIR